MSENTKEALKFIGAMLAAFALLPVVFRISVWWYEFVLRGM